MACLIKYADRDAKGILVFTTQERDHVIFKNPAIQNSIKAMKRDWVFGIHHNWHDFNFVYNPLFDFHMAGAEDLLETTGQKFPLIPLDACNFSPDCFSPSRSERHWDILYIANPVFFKRIPEFFKIIRSLYDEGKMYRALLISALPKKFTDKKHQFHNIREVYEATFNADERQYFNLFTPQYDAPTPYDLSTLAHFYKSAKIFVHTADEERRCRVAAYAWASGLPVVGMNSVASLLPKHLRKAPYLFEPRNYAEFPKKIEMALNFRQFPRRKSESLARNEMNAEFSKPRLARHFKKFFLIAPAPKEYFLDNLDIRLGRHHGLSAARNRINMEVKDLLKVLQASPAIEIPKDQRRDPEYWIAQCQSNNSDSKRGLLGLR